MSGKSMPMPNADVAARTEASPAQNGLDWRLFDCLKDRRGTLNTEYPRRRADSQSARSFSTRCVNNHPTQWFVSLRNSSITFARVRMYLEGFGQDCHDETGMEKRAAAQIELCLNVSDDLGARCRGCCHNSCRTKVLNRLPTYGSEV